MRLYYSYMLGLQRHLLDTETKKERMKKTKKTRQFLGFFYISLTNTTNHSAELKFLLLETILEKFKSKFSKHKVKCEV